MIFEFGIFRFYVSGSYSWTCEPVDYSTNPEVSFIIQTFVQALISILCSSTDLFSSSSISLGDHTLQGYPVVIIPCRDIPWWSYPLINFARTLPLISIRICCKIGFQNPDPYLYCILCLGLTCSEYGLVVLYLQVHWSCGQHLLYINQEVFSSNLPSCFPPWDHAFPDLVGGQVDIIYDIIVKFIIHTQFMLSFIIAVFIVL